MANQLSSLQLTNACDNLTAQAWALSEVLDVIKVDVGSGFPAIHDNVQLYTHLNNFKMHAVITGINNLIPGQLTVRAQISSADATSTFNLNEIGVYANIAGGSSVLIGYCTTGSNSGVTITPTGSGTPTVQDWAFVIVFSQEINSSGVIQMIQVVGIHGNTHILGALGYNGGIDPLPPAGLLPGLVPGDPGGGLSNLVNTTPVSFKLPGIPGFPILTNGDMSVQNSPQTGTFSVRTAFTGNFGGSSQYFTDNWKAVFNLSQSNKIQARYLNWDGLFTPDNIFKYPRGYARFSCTANVAISSNEYFDVSTFVEAIDLEVALSGSSCVSALARSPQGPITILAILTSGDGTQFFSHQINLTTSWKRFFFATPSTWPTVSDPFNRNNLNNLGIKLTFRLICGGGSGGAQVPDINNAWTTGLVNAGGGGWNPFASSGSAIDIADVRLDANSVQPQLPIFEPFALTFHRCLRLFESLTVIGQVFGGDPYFPSTCVLALVNGNYLVNKRITPNIPGSNIHSVYGNGYVQMANGYAAQVQAIDDITYFGFNQMSIVGTLANWAQVGLYCYVVVDARF